jgi:hypothetical protein
MINPKIKAGASIGNEAIDYLSYELLLRYNQR